MRIRLYCTFGELLGRTHFGAATYRFSEDFSYSKKLLILIIHPQVL